MDELQALLAGRRRRREPTDGDVQAPLALVATSSPPRERPLGAFDKTPIDTP